MFDRVRNNLNRFWSSVRGLISSIRLRLALWFVLILAVVIGLFCAFIYTRQVQDLRAAAAARLELKTRRLGGFLRFAGGGFFDRRPLQIPNDPSSGASVLQENDVLAFLSTDGRVLQSWGPATTDDLNQVIKASQSGPDTPDEPGGILIRVPVSDGKPREEYLFGVARVEVGGQTAGYFLVGNPVDPDRQLPRLLASLLLGVLATLAVALVGGFWLADRAIHPVKKITQTAHTIGETDLSQRLHLNSKDELGELADTFDEMLDRLQAAFERQRQFTADASHELRTPLTIVDLEAGRALAARRSPQEYERSLKVIHSENQFMVRLVNNLLTLARMDAGQVTLQSQALDLSDIALEVVERLAPLARKEGVRLQAGELPELPICGDRQYLAQMLSNLVDNAIKYSRGQDRCVQIRSGERPTKQGSVEQRGQAWVAVSDNGPGIPPQDLPHLFDRFYQVDKARTQGEREEASAQAETPSGAGLGLSIARWIAQAHGGEIRVQSELGHGTTFEVSFPLATSACDPSPPEEND